jgi:hypothetical protein
MLYTERLNFVKDNISYWIQYGGSTPIENGFTYCGCKALFIENGFHVNFGFYDPEGKKLAEYTLNTESGTALMLYDERYDKDCNKYTSILADILGGLIGSDEYFTLINKPIIICEDAPNPMSIEDIWKDIVSGICRENDNYPAEYKGE